MTGYKRSRLAASLIAIGVAASVCTKLRAEPVSIHNLMDALHTVNPDTASPQVCDEVLRNTGRVNAPALFYGAWHCFALSRNADGTVLLLLGQVRSTTDMGAFTPKTEKDKQKAAELYGVLFYQLGGSGNPDWYRDAAFRDEVTKRLRDWHAELPKAYDPGWAYAPPPQLAKFAAIAQESLDARRRQVMEYGAVMADERYYAAELEMRELKKNNPKGFFAGTPDSERANQLRELMRKLYQEKMDAPAPPKDPK